MWFGYLVLSLFGLALISVPFLALELILTSTANSNLPRTLINQIKIKGVVLELKDQDSSGPFNNPAWLGINPGLWVFSKALSYQKFSIKVQFDNLWQDFNLSREDFDKFSKVKKVVVVKKTYRQEIKRPFFVMLFLGSFKRKAVEEYTTSSLELPK